MASIEEQLGITKEHPGIVVTGEADEDYAAPISEVSLSSIEAAEAARSNMDFLAALAMPEVFQFNFPIEYHAIWAWLISKLLLVRDFSKIALGIPRGFAKTTVIKLLTLYIVLFTRKNFVLIVGAGESNAVNIIADVIDMLDHPNIKALFGDWRLGIERDTLTVKKFGFRGRNIVIAGIGQGGALRGLNLKNQRPDVMIFEDIQSREDADSEVISTSIEQWLHGTAKKAKSPFGCLYIYVANMYPTKFSILRKLKDNPKWVKFITGAIRADGTSLWEELHPLAQLIEEYEDDVASGQEATYLAELMNDENANLNNKVDLTKIPPYKYEGHVAAGAYIIVDPANDKANSDAVAITGFGLFEAVPVALEVDNGRYNPEEIIKRSISMAFRLGAGTIFVEAVGFQYSLKYWYEKIMDDEGIFGIDVVPIYPGKVAKNSRILTMFKELIAGTLAVHPKAWPIVSAEITSFNPAKLNNIDNILDCLTYANRVQNEFYEYIKILSPLSGIDHHPYEDELPISLDELCEF